VIEQNQGLWDKVESTGSVTGGPGGQQTLALTTAASAQHAWLASNQSIDVDEGPILEAWVNVASKGDNAVVDIDIGLASATGTTDWEALAAYIAAHINGNSANLMVHSDDGTTDSDEVDSGVDIVEGTYDFVQIDLRDKTAPAIYVNGVAVTVTGLTLAAYTSTLKAVMAVEKSGTDDTPGSLAVRDLTVRAGGRA
jgi:hypothetical protein